MYKICNNYKTTNEELTEWLSFEKTEFHKHAEVTPYLISENNKITGRFLAIVDQNMPEYYQVAFLEFTDTTSINLSNN